MWRKAFTWVILASAIPANSPAAENVDEIIAKNIDARGGIEALSAITSARIAGMLKLDDVEGSYAVEWKKPGMFRMDYEMRGATNTQAYDGKSGWAMNAFSSNPDAENLTGRRLKRIKAKTDYIQGDLINYKEKGHKISLIGKKKIRGREAFKLKRVLP